VLNIIHRNRQRIEDCKKESEDFRHNASNKAEGPRPSVELLKVSVCMAVYNGERYIHEQIVSILPQLNREDGIVIVDDCSTDHSVSIIETFHDSRITLLRNEQNCGVLKAFEKALMSARGDLIFLCDQDDVWRSDKVQVFKNIFSNTPEISLAVSDASIINAGGDTTIQSIYASRRFHPGLLYNLARNRYFGCTMGFRRSLLAYCIPFPSDIPMHDVWIGMVNQLVGKTAFIDERLMSYRRHDSNHTKAKHASLSKMVCWRYALVTNLARLYVRILVSKHGFT